MASEVFFAKRRIDEYESTVGPRLILITDSPLPNDKKEILDSVAGTEYLSTCFKSKFKSADTHVTYVSDNETPIPFTRQVFPLIVERYKYKNTINLLNVQIAFVGQKAFDRFMQDYSSTLDTNTCHVFVNQAMNTIKCFIPKVLKEDVIIPYTILPGLDEDYSDVANILDRSQVASQISNSPYCPTKQIVEKFNNIVKLYETGDLKQFRFNAKLSPVTNKIEYLKVFDSFTNIELLYCPTDVICSMDLPDDIKAFRQALKAVLTTVPVYGKDCQKIMDLFSYRDSIKVINEEDVVEEIKNRKSFVVTGHATGTESEWYKKWYKEVFKTHLDTAANKRVNKREGYDIKHRYEWIYDIEVFKEDWLFVAKSVDGTGKVVCWNDAESLGEWVKDKILIGFNNASYDDVVIRHALVLPWAESDALSVKEYSDIMITGDGEPIYPKIKKGFEHKKPNFLSWDISFHMPFDTRRNSLKKLTMSVLNRRNYDSSVSFDIDRPLTLAEMKEVEQYCELDVDNTRDLFLPDPADIEKQKTDPKHKFRDFARDSYDIRWNLIVTYNMRAKTLINRSSSFAGKLLCGEDAKANLKNTFKIVDGKLEYYHIPDLAYKELAGTPLLDFYIKNQQNPEYITEKFEYYLGGEDDDHKYQFGFGGLHQALLNYGSQDLVNMDVASLYPSLLVQYKLMSRGAEKNPDSYEQVYHTRLAAKKEGRKLLNEGLKLILNGAIGAMLTKTNPLYDTWTNSSICVHGQLLLFILVKRLFDAGFNIVQTNTDGIMIERQADVDFMPIAEKWMEETRLVLEFDEISILQQNNVNNYYCLFLNGKVKSKGFYLSNEKFGKATSKILCNIVTNKPILDGVAPRDFVIFKRHGVGEIYDALTKEKLEGRSLAFVVGYPHDHRTGAYYSRSRNSREVVKKDENGKTVKDELGNNVMEVVNSESKITGFTDHMLLVDDINALTMEEINTREYISFAKNLLNRVEDFGPYYNENFLKVDDPSYLQALNPLKDNTDPYPTKSGVYCYNFLFECDYLTKEEQEEIIDGCKDKLYRVVWSGNKSYHCVVRLDKPVTSIQYKKVWYHLQSMLGFVGADEQANQPSKYTRVPDQINPKTGNMQQLYLFDKNVIDRDKLLEEMPKLKDVVPKVREYTGELTIDALKKHIKRLKFTEGSRYEACQKLSPALISLVSEEELLEMIGIKLEKDHKYVIRSKRAYWKKKQYEQEMLEESGV